jgi:hypothetical protein
MDADPPNILPPSASPPPHSPEAPAQPRRAGWGMQRGESVIAGMALATLTLLLVTLGIAASLIARSQK